jgi:hypothetical protein
LYSEHLLKFSDPFRFWFKVNKKTDTVHEDIRTLVITRRGYFYNWENLLYVGGTWWQQRKS